MTRPITVPPRWRGPRNQAEPTIMALDPRLRGGTSGALPEQPPHPGEGRGPIGGRC
ncbi:hypothetical protein SPHINGO391_490080 [Sphingomonas aurantiaca]|uniref:Uncharacterized protein n=1 Tax=Sphingomonas aurantiaca TaxID=185949 RepID=A0A5E8A3N8_9SPHN|nr:hypothetical protein SPHINGO391_490080 [Sphingomonas aurantiaca]